MFRYLFATLIAITALPNLASADENQVLELRTYTLVDAAAEEKLDAYLEQALIPALKRLELGPIGVFDQAEPAGEGPIEVMLLVSGPSVETVTGAAAKLVLDNEYLEAGKEYLSTPHDQPLLKRIRSELLLSFDCWPKVAVPKQKQEGQPRLFELRTYESSTEKIGQLKVEMFNSGEVPIFLDCGIAPVFMGHALIGERMPNLTYMSVYDDSAALETAWENFFKHPDWQVLKEVKKYKGTVSKIHKSVWTPKSYSEL